MNKIHQRRIYLIILMLLGLSLATGFILYALNQNINVFFTPSEITGKTMRSDYHFRLGGMVKKGSIIRKNDLAVEFTVTDLKQEIPVRFSGILPDLFREGTGVIAFGSLDSARVFNATQILAKHDENYMPKNVYQALREKSK